MDSIRSYGKMIFLSLRLVWKSSPKWTLINFALIIFLGILPVVALYLTKLIIDTITVALTTADKVPYVQQITVLILMAGGVGILLVFSRSLSDLGRNAQSLEVTDAVFEILHAKSIEVDLEYYDDPEYQNTLHRAQKEAFYRPTMIVNELVTIGQSAISLGGITLIIFSFNIWLGIILLLVALPAVFVRIRYSKILYNFLSEQAESERRALYYHTIMTDPVYAKEVRMFNIGQLLKNRFNFMRSDLREKQLDISKNRFFYDFLAQSVATAALFVTLGYVAYQAVLGFLTIGDTVLYYMAFQSGLLYLQTILFNIAALYEDHLFISNLNQFLIIEPIIKKPVNPLPVPETFHNGVTFHDVSFTYPGVSSPSLKNISFSIGPSEIIAIVGENGSGKTSIIKLLCHLYNPTTGSITADSIDIREFDPIQWRSRISVIFQDYVRYQMTVRENIWLGSIETEPDLDLIQKAAKWSGADSVIRRLPEGYNTIIGRWFQDGQELSQGEWQRIALARAFYRNADIVVLDEPSASLDPLTEAKMFKEFKVQIQGRSAIIISHRFSSVMVADRILVMHQGQIIEQGTHTELLARNGLYAHLFNDQTGMYGEKSKYEA